MSPIPLGILAASGAAGGAAYWVSNLTFSSNTNYESINSQRLASGTTNEVGATDGALLALFDNNGNTIFQKVLQSSSGDVRVFGTDGSSFDGTNHIVKLQDEFTGNSDLVLAKIDNNGSVVAATRLGSSNNFKVNTGAIDVDSSGNIYAGGYEEDTQNVGVWAKYDNNLVKQFDRLFFDNVYSDGVFDIAPAVDSSQNAYVQARWNNFNGGAPVRATKQILTKYNSGGTLQWQKVLYGSEDMPFSSPLVNQNDDIFITFRDQNTSGWGLGFVKYNPNGTINFQKSIFQANNNIDRPAGIVEDSAGNIYVGCYYSDPNGIRKVLIVSLTSDGAINWQQSIVVETGGVERYTYADRLALDENENLIIAFKNVQGNLKEYVAQLPNDGSITDFK